MRSCDICGKEITALTGHVQIKTDSWKGVPKPDITKEFCGWKHCVDWIEKNKAELLAARAILEKVTS